jgi:tetratricopeptide (TPR) repeat protein
MRHLARCLLCLPGKQTNSLGPISDTARHIWPSGHTSPRSLLFVLNAATCYRYPSRVSYRTRCRVTRAPLQWERDQEHAQPVTSSEYDRNKRDRDAIFAALRTHLLRPETPAKAVVDLLRRHFLKSFASTVSDLSQSERAILIEILHKVLDEWSQRTTPRNAVSPARLMAFYAQHRILESQDWAFCLNSLAWTAYEASFNPLDENIDRRLQRNVDTFLLLRQLLKAWKLFFYCHGREQYDFYEVLNTEHYGVWPLLQRGALPPALQEYSSKYGLRLLSFAPGWNSDGESFADQQLMCASMTSIAALFESIESSTAISILVPSTIIDWKRSTVSASRSSDCSNGTADPTEAVKATPELMKAPFKLSSDELSMLFIVGHALNSQSINLTLLRVALAKLVPENRIGQIMTIFSQFRSRAPEICGPMMSDQGNALQLPSPDLGRHCDSTSALTELSSRDPIDVLLREVNAPSTISELESLRQTFSRLRQRNPRMRVRDFQAAVYKRYLKFGSSEQEREVWNASPMIHTEKDLWAMRLDFYFRRNNIKAFADAWQGLVAASHTASAADWCKKLQLYFNFGRIRTALEHFDALLRLCGRGQHDNQSTVGPLDPGNLVTVETFNLMIENLLRYDKLSWAVAVKQRLDRQPDIKANGTTYDLFFSFWIDRGRRKEARKWLKSLAEASSHQSFNPFFKLIRHGLQQWPRSAPWADVHLVMETFSGVLGDQYLHKNILRRISVIPNTNGESSTIKISPIPESDTLKSKNKTGVADELTETVPMRADIPLDVESLCRDLVSLMSFIAEEYAHPKKARMMLVLWTFCVLQGLSGLHEVERRLSTELSQLPFRQQLRLLGGDIYQRSPSAGYQNFAYVRTNFGPEFAVRRLEMLGLGRYGSIIRNLPWRGFTSYSDQLLLEIGMATAEARTLFLNDIGGLYRDLENIRREEQAQYQSRMATKEGIWYLSDALVDSSGSLRKIPFEYWEPESKRQATRRFKLATAAPRLLGGEEALRRFKRRMIPKGRKALTKHMKGLFVRPLREWQPPNRRARQIRKAHRGSSRAEGRPREGTARIPEPNLQREALAQVSHQQRDNHAARDLPSEAKPITISATTFRSMTIPDADKTATNDQLEAQEVCSSPHRRPENQGNVRVRRVRSTLGRVIRWYC